MCKPREESQPMSLADELATNRIRFVTATLSATGEELEARLRLLKNEIATRTNFAGEIRMVLNARGKAIAALEALLPPES